MLTCSDVGHVMFDHNGWYLHLRAREAVLFSAWEELKTTVASNPALDYLIGVSKLPQEISHFSCNNNNSTIKSMKTIAGGRWVIKNPIKKHTKISDIQLI